MSERFLGVNQFPAAILDTKNETSNDHSNEEHVFLTTFSDLGWRKNIDYSDGWHGLCCMPRCYENLTKSFLFFSYLKQMQRNSIFIGVLRSVFGKLSHRREMLKCNNVRCRLEWQVDTIDGPQNTQSSGTYAFSITECASNRTTCNLGVRMFPSSPYTLLWRNNNNNSTPDDRKNATRYFGCFWEKRQ